MRSAVLHWAFLSFTALALQACGEQPAAEPARRTTTKKTPQSTSDQTAGSAQIPTGTNTGSTTTDNNSIPTTTGGTGTTIPGTTTGTGTGTPQTPTPSPQTPSPDTANGRVLNMGTVYNQGSTQWCWAYSTFHTLRTYYLNSTATDSATVAWRDALKKLDSASAFSTMMKGKRSSQQTGFPAEFLSLMQQTYSLPAISNEWTESYPRGYSSEIRGFGFISSPDYERYAGTDRSSTDDQVLAKVQEQIRAGWPAVYCDSGHCMSMYGFTKNGSSVTYNIADSMGGKTYTETESKVRQRLYMMMVR